MYAVHPITHSDAQISTARTLHLGRFTNWLCAVGGGKLFIAKPQCGQYDVNPGALAEQRGQRICPGASGGGIDPPVRSILRFRDRSK